jgi:hypothetical protein
MASTEQAIKTFFYIMTITGSSNRDQANQITIRGTISNEKHKTQTAIYEDVYKQATEVWNRRLNMTKYDFAVLFYSLEEDTL